MGVRIGRFNYFGPFESPIILQDSPGMFAVISVWEGQTSLVNIGIADQLLTCGEAQVRR